MTIASLYYAAIIDAGSRHHPPAEAACPILENNDARTRTDLIGGKTTALERLASLAYQTVNRATDAPDAHAASLPNLALRLLELWGEDGDGGERRTTAPGTVTPSSTRSAGAGRTTRKRSGGTGSA